MKAIREKLKRIVGGPAAPNLKFTVSEYSYRDVYAAAEKIRTAFSSGERNILVFTEDRAAIAASVLASLAADFSLVLPYAISGRALEEIRETIGFDGVVGDVRQRHDVKVFNPRPKAGEGMPLSASLTKQENKPFLKFFTGGSTGRPKIWTKTPENVFGEAFFLSETLGFSGNDRVLSTAPSYHIYGFLFSVLTPFISSSQVLSKTFSFPEEIRQCLKNDSPTVFAGLPVHYRVLRGGEIPHDTLRLAVSSAGRLEDEDGDFFHEKTGAELIEIYGSTETGGIATRNRAAGEKHLTAFAVADWKIEDERLHVRSPFISPDIETDADGYYRTGDRVEKIDDSRFSLLGRADGVAKVGGKRVDLEDVRNKIKGLSGVSDAFVFALCGEGGRQTDICAAVEGPVEAKALKSKLAESLEPYAMPRRIRIMKKIPVSPSGKYDRRTLEELFSKLSESGE